MQLQIARKSLLGGPQTSKLANKMSIRPESRKKDDVESEGGSDGNDDVALSKGIEINDKGLSPSTEDHRKSLQEEVEEAKFNPFYRLHIIGFFKGLLDRLSLLMQLPEALKVAKLHVFYIYMIHCSSMKKKNTKYQSNDYYNMI